MNELIKISNTITLEVVVSRPALLILLCMLSTTDEVIRKVAFICIRFVSLRQ